MSIIVAILSFLYQLQNVDIEELKKANVDLVVIDNEHSKEEVAQLKPKKVLAYISIGEAENYRSYWKKQWNRKRPSWLGKENESWPGNYTVKQFWGPEWWDITTGMIDEILEKGYDGLALDKVDVYEDLGDTEALRNHMVDYVVRISQYCKKKNPKCMIIAHNASMLLNDKRYLGAIDGITQENLVYDWNSDGFKGSPPDEEWQKKTITELQLAKDAGKLVMVLEYVSGKFYKNAKTKLGSMGFLSYSAPHDLESLRLADAE